MLGERVEGDVGARTLGVVVGAAELGASGGEATTGSDGGQSGADSGGSVHLRRDCELNEATGNPIETIFAYLEVQRGENGRSGMGGWRQSEHRKVRMRRSESHDSDGP